MSVIITTDILLMLGDRSVEEDRNRQPNMKVLRQDIDPLGYHILEFHMPHNDVEIRTLWLVKVESTSTPVRLFIDMSFESWEEVSGAGRYLGSKLEMLQEVKDGD